MMAKNVEEAQLDLGCSVCVFLHAIVERCLLVGRGASNSWLVVFKLEASSGCHELNKAAINEG